MLEAAAVSIENRPNSATEVTSTALRPMRLVSRPPQMAPKNRPNVLALKKFAIFSGVGASSAPIPPAATPAACRSMPSQSAASAQNRMVVRTSAGVAGLFMEAPSAGIAADVGSDQLLCFATRALRSSHHS